MKDLFVKFRWFQSLATSDQELILSTARADRFKSGEYIARRKMPSDYWIGVSSGIVKLAITGSSGKGCTFSGVPPGGWFGEGSVLKRELRKYDVVALRASLILFVPADTFHQLLATSLTFNGLVIRQLNNRMGEFISAIQSSRLLDVDGRVARALAQLFNEELYPDGSSEVSISQEELGLLAGVSRQRANQALQRLEAEGLVRRSYNGLQVTNISRLKNVGIDDSTG